MSLTTDDFREFMGSDPADDETVPLGDALAEVAVDIDVDAVAEFVTPANDYETPAGYEYSGRSSYQR